MKIGLVNVLDGRLRRLVNNGTFGEYPAWSPLGARPVSPVGKLATLWARLK
jgi:hypothetical protein